MSKNYFIFAKILRMKISFSILFLFFSAVLFGQSLSGKILSEDGNPIPYVNIYLKKTNIGNYTDENGYYQSK